MQDKIKVTQSSQYRTLAIAWALMTVAAVVVAAILHAEPSSIIVLAVVLVLINFQLALFAIGLSKQPVAQAIGDLLGIVAFVILIILNNFYHPFALIATHQYDTSFWWGIYVLIVIAFAFDLVVRLIQIRRIKHLGGIVLLPSQQSSNCPYSSLTSLLAIALQVIISRV